MDKISIHALLAESDQILDDISGATGHFYPRSPCGERPSLYFNDTSKKIFLSTLSLRRATNCTSIGRPKRLYFYPRSPCGERRLIVHIGGDFFDISIHALLAESDPPSITPTASRRNFYPRSPCGERLFVFWTALNRL